MMYVRRSKLVPRQKSLSAEQEWREAGVRGIPSPFIKIYERGRDTPHASLPPLLRVKELLGEVSEMVTRYVD
jgi:hypothetical protein